MSMKDLTNTPTTTLLAEWIRWDEIRVWQYVTSHDEVPETMDSLAALAAELDRRVVGIRNVHGSPAFSDYRQIIYAKNDPAAREAAINIPIGELRDRLTWMLMKEGGDR